MAAQGSHLPPLSWSGTHGCRVGSVTDAEMRAALARRVERLEDVVADVRSRAIDQADHAELVARVAAVERRAEALAISRAKTAGIIIAIGIAFTLLQPDLQSIFHVGAISTGTTSTVTVPVPVATAIQEAPPAPRTVTVEVPAPPPQKDERPVR